jgi:hypothetical protein
MPLGAADGFIDQGLAAGKTNAPGLGVTPEKFFIREAGDQDSFVRRRLDWHMTGEFAIGVDDSGRTDADKHVE